MNIFCQVKLNEMEKQLLSNELEEHEVIYAQDYGEDVAKEHFMDCQVAFGNPPLDWIQHSFNLTWIQLESVGLDPYQEEIEKNNIYFSSLKGFFDRPVAETVIGGILALYREFPALIAAQQEINWIKDEIRPKCESIKDKNIFILGAGSIGKTVKDHLIPFQTSITFYDINPELSDHHSLPELDLALKNTDILIGCLPENDKTINFLNAYRFSLLQENSIIVNVGRGTLIDEDVLITLLKEKKLRGAFLDVTREEPIPPDSELWQTPNLILSQHTAGGTKDEVIHKVKFFLDNFHNYDNGQIKNLVNP